MLTARTLRFGPFELDVRTGELRKHGTRIRLQEQSFQILLMLLDHRGEVVLREDIRLRLWPNNTIVEFDHSINAAVKRLRNSLGESAEAPRYIETLAKRGYRFLGEVSEDGQENPRETQPEKSPRPAASGAAAPRYRILDKLGEGGMGVVYRAEDLRLSRAVALKFLPLQESDTPQTALQRFKDEARAASALNHPNICTIYGLEDLDGGPAIAMELVEGETLLARLAKGKLPLREALAVATQIAAALAAAHGKGVVHCDLKPGNIMLTKAGVKVLDFGLAKMEGRVDAGGVETGEILGTAHYMSPEQAQGADTDFRTDIFSFGVVFYQMLTGKKPFEAESAAGLRAAILENDPPPLGDMFPAPLDCVIRRCLAKHAEDRWQSAQDLGFALSALTEPGRQERIAPVGTMRSRRWLWPVTVTLGAVLGGGVVWLARRPAATLDNPVANARFTRITDFPGVLTVAAISPDGKFVAFVSDRDGPTDVFVSQVGSGRFINLTRGTAQNVSSQNLSLGILGFSGDGSQIWFRGADPATSIRIMPMLGGEPRTFLGKTSAEVAWSPDGTRLVYHPANDGDPMFVADQNGNGARQIFINRPGVHNHFPVWSLDSKWIYFVSGIPAANQTDLWRIAPEGGAPERLTYLNSKVGSPTPVSSRMVLFTALDAKGAGPWLWALDVESKLTRRVSFGLEKYTSVAGSADGRRLVATVTNPVASLWSVPIGDRPAEEHDVKPFPLPAVRALMPRFGGTALFYLSSQDAGDGLWRYQDGQALEIWKGSDGALLEPPGPSADGRRVAFVLRRSGRVRLQVAAGDGTDLQIVAPDLEVQGAPSWSPDGKWIVTGGADAKGAGLFKIPLDGGAPIRLTSGIALNPVWAPDGSLIAYLGANMGGRLPLRGVRPDGTPVELPDIKLQRDGERVRFLPTGSSLVYTQGFSTLAQDFWLLDLATKKSRPLSHLASTASIRAFDIAPDGKQIVFDRLRDNADIALIDLPK